MLSPALPSGIADGVSNTLPAASTPEVPSVTVDPTLPRSKSSAMPDLNSPNVPALKARVHQRLSDAECASLPLSALRFRPLRVEDQQEMMALHTEWFPVSYDEAFYTKSVQGELISLVATYTFPQAGGSSSSKAAPPTSTDGIVSAEAAQEEILGMITLSTQCEHHCEDIGFILGMDCAACCSRLGRHKDCLEASEEGLNTGSLAYILTLGVADGFRRRGLARELLRRSIVHVSREMPQVQAVYLHVVTYNDAAIHLYESMRFLRIKQFPDFYHLHGNPYDSYLYALYLHNRRPPLNWWLRNLLAASSWSALARFAWSSLWGEPALSGELHAETHRTGR